MSPAGPIKKKKTQILEAAAHLFATQGYSATSVEAIARLAKVAKPTVYSHFEGKRDVLEALLQTRTEELVSYFSQLEIDGESPEKVVTAIIELMADVFAREETIGIYRMLAVEGARDPELAKAYLAKAENSVQTWIESYLAKQAKAGQLKIDDPAWATYLLLETIKGKLMLKPMFGLAKPPTKREIKAHVRQCISHFLEIWEIR